MFNIFKNNNSQYLKATAIGKHFNLSARQMNKIFEKLRWAIKDGENWKITRLGTTNGGKQEFDKVNKVEIIVWDSKIKENIFLKEEIIKESKNIKKQIPKEDKTNLYKTNTSIRETNQKKMTNEEKKEKGDIYEIFLKEYFEEKGYIAHDNGIKNGRKDRGIDLILRANKINLFIQAKHWKKESGNTIKQDDLRKFIGDVALYLEDYPAFAMTTIKRYFITSEDILDFNAKKFLEQHKEKIEYIVIPMKDEKAPISSTFKYF
ncbi:restriction endonuclease [Sulfurimonas sp.]|uniref:restriction endonuclease n=1 Tax=Sulfurimonas sp. TaxID=2022749 RepID=UPI001A0683AA|nr:restriction endonuclease [Sulfurimonas sp.]MBE0515152.1 restriction endonuclease [Sulfurimonas sp.]